MNPPEDGPSLTILSGPQSGTRMPIEAGSLIGSDDACQILIPTASPIQAQIHFENGAFVVADAGGAGIWLNDDRVSAPRALRDGDILWLGSPGAPSSVMLQCRGLSAGLPPASVAPAVDTDFVMDEPPVFEPVAPEAAPEEFVMDEPAAPAPGPVDPPSAEVFFVSDSVFNAKAVVPEAPAPAAEPPEEEPFFVADAPSTDAAPVWSPAPEPPPIVIEPEPETPEFFVAEPEPAPVPPPAPAAPPAPEPPAFASGPEIGVPSAPAPRPPRAEPAPTAPRPSSPRPPAAASSRPRPQTAAAPAAPRSTGGGRGKPAPSGGSFPVAAVGAGVLVLGVAVGAITLYLMRAPSITEITPARARIGETITIAGKNLGAGPAQNEVLFGDVAARVLEASPTELKVAVPNMRLLPGEDTPLSLKVRVGTRQAKPLTVTVYDAPKIAKIVPDVAMPGDTIDVEGTGWSKDSVAVLIGEQPAELLSMSSTRLHVRVPPLSVPEGQNVEVVVASGTTPSAPASLLLGRLPIITEVAPARAGLGELLRLKGKGFWASSTDNQVTIAGVPAIILAATDSELQVIVPRLPSATGGTSVPIEVRVSGLPNVGQAQIAMTPFSNPMDLTFTVEPFMDAAGHEHAIVATELGPLFVVSAAQGKSAAQRARAAQEQLTAAVVRFRASLDEDVALRGLETGSPALSLQSRPQAILDVTDDDAAGYNEGWVKNPSGGLVTRARLGIWWEALAKDLVLVFVRGKRPERTPVLAPEAKLLAQIQERAQKTGRFGLPREVFDALKPAERETLRVLALHVPPGVRAQESGGKAAVMPPDSGPKLEGLWQGAETVGGQKKRISITFEREGRGTLTYAGRMALGVPIRVQDAPKGTVRISAQIGSGTRYYVGRWDGQKISGQIFQEAREGETPVGTFELSP